MDQRRDIAIVTDSTSDLPEELLQRYRVHIVPLYVLWGGQTLRDGQDIDRPTFYRRLTSDPAHPTTSQPTPSDFALHFQEISAPEILVVTISSGLSGTYDSAMAAAKDSDKRVRVVDSRSVSMGVGWQVLAAARAREQGASLDEMAEAAEAVRSRLSVLFTVDTLDYLHRGGRIGGAARLIGTALQLKPMLAIDTQTGRVDAVERTRTRRKAMQRIVEATFERLPDVSADGESCVGLRVAVMHAAAEKDATLLEGELRARCRPEEFITCEVTPVIGVHGGPGLVGIIAYAES